MTLTVQLFAQARDLAGTAAFRLELSPSPTVADVRAALTAREPRLNPIADSLLVAVDGEYATNDALIPENAEVACFPPVSGG